MAIELRQFQFANSAKSTLAAGISAAATSLQVEADDGALFPSVELPGAFDIECDRIASLVVTSADGSEFEVVYVTARSGDVLTVERGKEETTAIAFAAGAAVKNVATRGFFEQQIAVTTAPTAVVVEGEPNIDGTSFDLTWSASTVDADDELKAYDIYRDDGDGYGPQYLASVASDVLTYTDSSIDIANGPFLYTVYARACVGGESAASNIFSSDQTSLMVLETSVFNTPATNATVTGAASDRDATITFNSSNLSLNPFIPVYPKPSGKYYFEFEYLAISSRPNSASHLRLGFGGMAHQIIPGNDSFPGSGTDGVVYYDTYEGGTTAGIWTGSATQNLGAGSVANPPDVLQMAVDFDNDKVWFGKNGTWQGTGTQDPETNQGGYWPSDFTYTGISLATARPHYGIWAAGDTNESFALRVSEEFWTLTPPAGFEQWPGYQLQNGIGTVPDFVDPDAEFVFDVLTPGAAIVKWNGGVAPSSQLRSNNPKTAGKRYFELTMMTNNTVGTSSNCYLGVVDQSASSLDNVGRGGGTGVGVDGSADVRNEDNTTGNYSSPNWNVADSRTLNQFNAGDTLMFAVDLDNGRFYVGINGTWLDSQDPTNASHGCPLPAGTNWVPAIQLNISTLVFFFNTGGVQFNEALPTGYVAWDTE